MPLTLDWRQFFPLPTPRTEQARALDWICEQFEAGHREIVAELGTGIGKSAIAVTVGRWLEAREKGTGSYNPGVTVLTSQKVLQDQYVADFKEARDLRSSANFSCSGPVGGTCGETSRVRKAVIDPEKPWDPKNDALRCGQCPYRSAKDDFVSSQLGVTNYSYFLSESTYAGEIPPRRLLVLDEAHNVEDEVRRWTSFEVTDSDAQKLGEDLEDARRDPTTWLYDRYRPAIEKKLATTGRKLKKFVKAGGLGNSVVKDLANENDTQDKRLCQINRLQSKGGELLVSWHDDPVKHRVTVRFQPLDVTELVKETLYERASAVLLMSATLLDRDVFCKSVGLPDAPYLSIPTPFKKEAFGLSFRPVGKMTMDHIERSLKDFPKTIRRIIDENPGHKGIIHTMNYRITRYLQDNLGDYDSGRLLYQGSAKDRETILRKHIASDKATIIVSPSMMEGLDLRDDLGRFQIVCKVPYPDMSDPIIKHKSREWYSWRTVRTLVQAVGRGVRSETDWVRTYILDLSFLDLMEWSSNMIPDHLRKGMLVEDPF